MGARDKLWIELDGETLIARAARRLAGQTGDVILNVNRFDERLDQIGLPVVPDASKDHEGPLAGIAAALRWAEEKRRSTTHVVGVSVDSPFFPGDLVSRLGDGVESHPDEIAIAFSEGFPQPVFGLWPVTCLDPLNRFLEKTGDRKVMAFVREQPWRRVDFPASDPPAFFNINTPEDLTAAHKFLEQEAASE
jgi:molybdopterin-guanine dinucleotide biosynthesis protein A